MIDIQVCNDMCRILTVLGLREVQALVDMYSFEVEKSEYASRGFNAKSHYKSNWDGKRRLFEKQWQRFPVGLLPGLLKLFSDAGTKYNLIDKREHLPTTDVVMQCNVKERRDYQYSAVVQCILNGYGIVKAATGSGKTVIAAMVAYAIHKDSVFIVHTRDLLYQSFRAFCEILGPDHIGIIGDGKFEPRRITIATVQTLAKAIDEYESYAYDEDYESGGAVEEMNAELEDKISEWAGTIGLVQFDEVQRVASRTAYCVRYMFGNADYAFGYSASPWRDDGADLMIEAAFGSRIVDITASELIRQGYLVRPHILIKPVRDNIWSGNDYNKIYKSAIVENMVRNMQVAGDAIEMYKNGESVLVLVTQLQHGQILEDMIRPTCPDVRFISGKSRMKVRTQTIQDMRDGKLRLIIASTIADVGLDIPRITTIVEAGAGKSSVTALQRLGRIMRPFAGKDHCYYITYRDTAPYLCMQIDSKIRIWRTEPEFDIKEIVNV